MEIGNLVVVKETGQVGSIRILEGGCPPHKVYVDLTAGADAGYIYMRMYVSASYKDGKPGASTLTLNVYDVDQVELVEG